MPSYHQKLIAKIENTTPKRLDGITSCLRRTDRFYSPFKDKALCHREQVGLTNGVFPLTYGAILRILCFSIRKSNGLGEKD